MRQITDPQLQIGETDISAIRFDAKSRDDIPPLLQGLQHVYVTPALREEVFQILEEMIPVQVNRATGRPGMALWKILLMGVLRLNLNWDYDRLHQMVNEHRTIRQMLGHGLRDDEATYNLQTLKDNVALLTPEVLDRINQVVVKAGHALVGAGDGGELGGRCDSFVVETDVHYPTDINLLWDGVRKVIKLTAGVAKEYGLSGWDKSEHNLRQLKRLFERARRLKRSSSPDEEKQAARQREVSTAHREYVERAGILVARAEETLAQLPIGAVVPEVPEIERFVGHARRQMDQIERRVLGGETIPHAEKVFSLFEEHTEWISKGKAGVPVELGLNVCVLEDQYGFILHHRVMQGERDEAVAVPMVEETQARFAGLNRCSFDGGFYAPSNWKDLRQLLETSVLRKPGRRSPEEEAFESSDLFVECRRQHAAVESAINALEVHGLDRCPDHGIKGFKRYVALAVVARNLQQLGAILHKRRARVHKGRRKRAA